MGKPFLANELQSVETNQPLCVGCDTPDECAAKIRIDFHEHTEENNKTWLPGLEDSLNWI